MVPSLQISLRRNRSRIVQLFVEDRRLDAREVCSCDASALTNTLNVHDNRENFARASQAQLEQNGRRFHGLQRINPIDDCDKRGV